MAKNNAIYYYFKIFNNIKSEHEVTEFANLELEGLFGKVQKIYNFYDVLEQYPLKTFTDNSTRIQDIVINELPYGKIHGFYGKKFRIDDITRLIKRLAYTREIFVVMESQDTPSALLKKIFPQGVIGKNVQYFKKENKILFRFITNQYFLEKSEYISKVSRNEKEIDKNVEILFNHLIKNIYRIPASSTLSIGKRLEDYFAIREEPSLYLNHYMHPYKGKFHPKMVRSLINYIYPYDKGLVCDNFAGSGTLLVEAGYLGLDNVGVEINPLSVLMSNVKCHSIMIPVEKLKNEINTFLKILEDEINGFTHIIKGQNLLFENKLDAEMIVNEAKTILAEIEGKNGFRSSEYTVQKIIIARELIKLIKDKSIREFLLLALSGTISDISRRTKNEFEKVFKERINDLFLRIYLFHKLNTILKIPKVKSQTYVADTRDMKVISDESIDGIVNSPPYSTALDYIKNDYPQLMLLRLVESIEQLEKNMMGNPRKNYDKKELLNIVKDKEKDPLFMSVLAHKYVDILLTRNRQDAGLRVYKFFIDMLFSLQEMYRVMKKGSKCAIILGNNHFLVDDKYLEIPNDDVIVEIGKKIGFKEERVIRRNLQKTSVGNIRRESVIIFEK